MKLMRLHLILLMLLLATGLVTAQEGSPTTFVPFKNETFGIQGIVPEGWHDLGQGVYGREPTTARPPLLILNAIPGRQDSVLRMLLPQLGLGEPPEPTGTLETDALKWTFYKIELTVTAIKLTIDLALAENDGVTHMVFMQAAPDEYETLHTDIFIPVVEAYALLPVTAQPTAAAPTEDLPYIAEEVSFSHDDITLNGTLTYPEGDGPFPAVIFVSGGGQQNRDSWFTDSETKQFRLIADHLTRNGIAVLRFDDRGFDDSITDFSVFTGFDFADDVTAAVDYLLTRDDINPNQIGLLSYDEGSIIAELVAVNNPHVAFIITLGASAMNGQEIWLNWYINLIGDDASEAEIQAEIAYWKQFIAAIAAGEQEELYTLVYNRELEWLQTMPQEERELVGDVEARATRLVENIIKLRFTHWNRFLLNYDPAEDWAKITVPVLGIFGEHHFWIDATLNSAALEAALEKAGNEDYEIIVIPDADHQFYPADTDSSAEDDEPEETFVPDLLPTITDWLLARVDVVEK